MPFTIKILGSGSAAPLKGRHQSAQLVTLNQQHYLIDCGEGTQYRLIEGKTNLNKISVIFISHLHGDHMLGLVGLISTMNLLSRKNGLKIFSPSGLRELIIENFRISKTALDFELEIIEVHGNSKHQVYEDENVKVLAFPLVHGIETYGYWLEEKPRPLNLIKEKIAGLSVEEMGLLKNGQHVYERNGELKYNVEEFTHPQTKCLSYAYCSDTMFSKKVIEAVRSCDWLYHEATYLEIHFEKAVNNQHATAKQAAIVAKEAGVQKLLIGHLSSRYENFDDHLAEAMSEFPNTFPAIEGKVFILVQCLEK
jgi:ribonuclease Z